MRPGDNIQISGASYTIGPLVGSGRMGEVYALQETIENRSWVVKVAREGVPEAASGLRVEFNTLKQIAAAYSDIPPVPIVQEGRIGGTFALVLENIPEGNQMAFWLSTGLSNDPLSERDFVWKPALDYLTLLQNVHMKLKRSVTDRKSGDLRIMREGAAPRLVVLDWGLLAPTVDEITDIRIFGQLWYTMISPGLLDFRNLDTLDPLSLNWNPKLSIGGRLILRQCLTGKSTRLESVRSEIQHWIDTLSRPVESTLQTQASLPASETNEGNILHALRASDLLTRIKPELGKPLLEQATERYYGLTSKSLERASRQALQSLNDASRAFNALREKWASELPTLTPVLDRWLETLEKLRSVDDERQLLGANLTVVRKLILEAQMKLSDAEMRPQAHVEGFHTVLDDLRAMMDKVSASAQTSQTLRTLRLLTTELTIVVRLTEASQFAGAGDLPNATTALQEASDLARFSEGGQSISPMLAERLNRWEQARAEAQVIDPTHYNLTQQLRDLIVQGNTGEAIQRYQQALLGSPFAPYQRALWLSIVEPAYLVEQMNAPLNVRGWMELLTQINQYLRQSSVSIAVTRRILDLLGKPYKTFFEAQKGNHLSTDVAALALGELLMSVYERCQQIQA